MMPAAREASKVSDSGSRARRWQIVTLTDVAQGKRANEC